MAAAVAGAASARALVQEYEAAPRAPDRPLMLLLRCSMFRSSECSIGQARNVTSHVSRRRAPGVERVREAAGQVNVSAPELNRLGDIAPLAELVPGLDRDDFSAGPQRRLQLGGVIGAVSSIDVEAV